jgi:tetratricopeptide (TPR) repeat protein
MRATILMVFTAGLLIVPFVPARGSVPSVDSALFQRLSAMEYADVTKELAEMVPATSVRYVMGLSVVSTQKNDLRMAQMYLELALSTARANQMPKEEAAVLYFYARVLDARSMLEESVERLSEAVDILTTADDEDMLKECLQFKANVEHRRGDYGASLKTHTRLLDLASTKTDELIRAHAMYEIAMLHYKMGHAGNGIKELKDALAVFERREQPQGMADCLKALGNAESARGDKRSAETYYRRAREGYKKAGASHGEANCLYNLGILFREQRRFEASIASLQEAVAAYTESSSVTGVGMAKMEMGHTYFLNGNRNEAETHLLKAEKLLKRSGNMRRLALAEEYMAELQREQGAISEAIRYLKSAVSHYEAVDLQRDATRVRTLLGVAANQDLDNKTEAPDGK